MTTIETTFTSRLKIFAKAMKLNQEEMALRIGTTRNNYAKMSDNPTLERITSIINAFPELNPQWLITGAGSMLNNQSVSLNNTAVSDGYKINSDNTNSNTNNDNYENMSKLIDELAELRKINLELTRKVLGI